MNVKGPNGMYFPFLRPFCFSHIKVGPEHIVLGASCNCGVAYPAPYE